MQLWSQTVTMESARCGRCGVFGINSVALRFADLHIPCAPDMPCLLEALIRADALFRARGGAVHSRDPESPRTLWRFDLRTGLGSATEGASVEGCRLASLRPPLGHLIHRVSEIVLLFLTRQAPQPKTHLSFGRARVTRRTQQRHLSSRSVPDPELVRMAALRVASAPPSLPPDLGLGAPERPKIGATEALIRGPMHRAKIPSRPRLVADSGRSCPPAMGCAISGVSAAILAQAPSSCGVVAAAYYWSP